MKYTINGTVAVKREAGGVWGRLEISAPDIARAAKPGQFVQVKAWERTSPLLRRPFSIAGVTGDENILLLVKKVGPATKIITGLAAGDKIDVTGPLGNTFPAPPEKGRVFLVAGGVGIAPLRFYLSAHKPDGAVVFFGSRDSSELGILEDAVLENAETVLTTEDGSAGEKGLVTAPLERYIKEEKPAMVLTCGPLPMMRAVAEIAAAAGVPCSVSTETYMGCGIGACMGCVVPVKNVPGKEYLHACMDGPVMDASIIDWDGVR